MGNQYRLVAERRNMPARICVLQRLLLQHSDARFSAFAGRRALL
jgi:hypothetical protein